MCAYRQDSGSLFLVKSQTASNSVTLDFVGLTAFVNYYVLLNNVTPVIDHESFQMLVSNDGGATWITGYSSGFNYHAYNSNVYTNATSTTSMKLSGPIVNSQTYNGFLNLFQLNLVTPFQAIGDCFYNDSTVGTLVKGEMGCQSTTGINAIRFQMSTGNISTGTVSLYAIRTN